jgi:hypothetical protein
MISQAIKQVKQPAELSNSGSGEEPNYNIAMGLVPDSPTDEQLEQMRKIFAKQKTPEPEPNPNAPLPTQELLALNTIFKSQPPKMSPTSSLHSFATQTLHSAAQGLSGMALLPPFQIASATVTVPPTTTASNLFSQQKGKSKKVSTTASGSGAIFTGSGGDREGSTPGGAPGSPGEGGGGEGGDGSKEGAAPLAQGQGFTQIPTAGGGLIGILPKPYDGTRS